VASVGILGGTFNPPHVGHLACARAALAQLDLDRVVLMPVAAPPHKALPDDPGPGVRLELCRLAAAGDDRADHQGQLVDEPEAVRIDHVERRRLWRPCDRPERPLGGLARDGASADPQLQPTAAAGAHPTARRHG